ncbi:unnamed protein product [Brugia pahangi]|uniref:C-type lectin domain-containing protein n=1 Tax=Brugia pahangi TaxID=6280 RepID=A0A0N4SXK7_BRUPA|nr:unnamed protein product [Brugia pahangi]
MTFLLSESAAYRLCHNEELYFNGDCYKIIKDRKTWYEANETHAKFKILSPLKYRSRVTKERTPSDRFRQIYRTPCIFKQNLQYFGTARKVCLIVSQAMYHSVTP